jgi:alpha/beta superfamily hydrolase
MLRYMKSSTAALAFANVRYSFGEPVSSDIASYSSMISVQIDVELEEVKE